MCRLDSLVGLFAVGCQPTAAADPFGLRRSAYGLVFMLTHEVIFVRTFWIDWNNIGCNLSLVVECFVCILTIHTERR